jgi:PilZ domain
LGNSLAPLAPSRKFSARAALVDLQESSRSLLSECFRQFGIESVSMTSDKAERLSTEKFEACVIRVGSHAGPVLESARRSRSNSRMVIYGLGGSVRDAMKLSQFGINAVFNEPLERPSALKLVRATQMLVLHEFRRYVRIPVVTQVSIVVGQNRQLEATSHEVSSGGMSLKSGEEVAPGLPVELSFALLTLPRIWIRGTVSWTKPANKTFGVRFDPRDERRLRIKEWVDAYLES